MVMVNFVMEERSGSNSISGKEEEED